jgi:hypothetical protein
VPETPGEDADQDGLDDATERRMGLDPYSADTDRDDLTDRYEIETSKTDPRLADTEGDRLNDAFEISQGLDPNVADNAGSAALDGAFATAGGDSSVDPADLEVDTALLEHELDLDSPLADADTDGFSDGLEVNSGSDPLSARSTPLHAVSPSVHQNEDDLSDVDHGH